MNDKSTDQKATNSELYRLDLSKEEIKILIHALIRAWYQGKAADTATNLFYKLNNIDKMP